MSQFSHQAHYEALTTSRCQGTARAANSWACCGYTRPTEGLDCSSTPKDTDYNKGPVKVSIQQTLNPKPQILNPNPYTPKPPFRGLGLIVQVV